MPRQTYPQAARLCRPADYKRVFASGHRQSDGCFSALTQTSTTGQARLGLVVPRRQLPRAVDRNRVKRMVREQFRRTRSELPALDIIVMVRTGAKGQTRQAQRAALERLWRRILHACRNSPDSLRSS